MRLVYLGSPEVAVPPLETVLDMGHEVVLVVTQPDRRRRRRGDPEPTPVRRAAESRQLEVVAPARAGEIVGRVRDSGAQLGLVVAFGQLLPAGLLEALPGGFVNVHYSLLPRWRGAAPVERAILAGDTETGVSLMRIGEGLDDGPLYAQRRTPIGPDDTAGDVTARLVSLTDALLRAELATIPDREPEPQRGEPTYAEKLTTDEFELDWSLAAIDLHRLVRAGNPRPGAWTRHGDERLKVWRTRLATTAPGVDDPAVDAPGTVSPDAVVATGDGALELVEVQPPGGLLMSGTAWLAGHARAETRTRLGRE